MQVGREKQLTLIHKVILTFLGLASGLTVSGAVFAFITMIGIVTRLSSKTKTAKYIRLYEDCIIVGGTIGNILTIFEFPIPIGLFGIAIFGLCCGIFVGCLAIALAEILKAIPIFISRINLTQGLPYIILSIALGKGIGAFYQLYLNR